MLAPTSCIGALGEPLAPVIHGALEQHVTGFVVDARARTLSALDFAQGQHQAFAFLQLKLSLGSLAVG